MGGKVDGGDDVIGIDGVWFGDAGDFDDEWSVGLSDARGRSWRRGGACRDREKNDDGVVGFTGFFEGNRGWSRRRHQLVDRGIVEGEFFADFGVVEEEAGDGDFVGFEGF